MSRLASSHWNRSIEKQVKAFLDVVVLAMLNGEPTHGYKIVANIHKEFGILLSPGSLYPLLHYLEDKRLIESDFRKGKIVYHTTPKRKEKFESAFAAYKASIQRMSSFVKFRGGISP